MGGSDRRLGAGAPVRAGVPVAIDPVSLRFAFLPPPVDVSGGDRSRPEPRVGTERGARRAERDRQRVLRILDELLPIVEPVARVHRLLSLVGDLLAAEMCWFEQVEPAAARRTTIKWPEGTGTVRSPAAVADHRGQLTALPTRHQLAIPLRLDRVAAVGCTAGRDHFPFSDDERSRATALQLALTPLQLFLVCGEPGTGIGVPTRTLLTAREQETLSLLATGLTAKAMARALAVSPGTIRKHLEHVYAKLGVNDRLSAVTQAQSLGLLPRGIRRTTARPVPDTKAATGVWEEPRTDERPADGHASDNSFVRSRTLRSPSNRYAL